MIGTIVAVLMILWVLGFSFHGAGGLIHILWVVAAVVLVFNLISGRRTAWSPGRISPPTSSSTKTQWNEKEVF
jgi:Family of unknown function (DUF5670)